MDSLLIGEEFKEAKGECPNWFEAGLRTVGSNEGLLGPPGGSSDVLLRPPRPDPLLRAESLSGVKLRANASTPCNLTLRRVKLSKSNLEQRRVREMGCDSLEGLPCGAKRDVEGGESGNVRHVWVCACCQQSRDKLELARFV